MHLNLKALLYFAVALVWVGIVSTQGQLVISNATTEVNFNPATGLFSVSDLASGRTFISQGNFSETTGTAAITTVTNTAFGIGPAIQYSHTDGNSDVIMLFTNLPFALFQSTLTNSSGQTVVSNHIHALVAQVNLNETTNTLISLGTGGLTTPGSQPASYAWLVTADPQSRNGVVGAWLTSDRGSGIVSNRVVSGVVQMDAHLDYGRLQFQPGQTQTLETFALGYFDDARVGLETWAGAIAQNYNIHLNPQPDGLCTYPMNQNGGASSPSAVKQIASFVQTNLALFGFSMIQIDSGWQAGITTTNPNDGSAIGPREFISVNPTGSYAAGMTPVSTNLVTNGITAGLWFSVCGSSATDPYFTNHPDWFVQTTNGGPYWVDFAGACLDGTYPPACNYISNFVYQIANVWGYKYFKTDGFWAGCAVPQKYVTTGYVNDGIGDAVFSDPSQPNIEAFRDGLKVERQAAGTNVYFDGCNIGQSMRCYSGSFGLVDGIRIGPDNAANWGSGTGSGSGWLRSPEFGSRHYFLHNRVWHNDPDTVYVRDSFTLSQAQTIASWYGVSGQLTLDGDWIPTLTSDRINLLERIMPHHTLTPRPVDYFENDPPNIWLLTQPATNNAPARNIIGVFNWSSNTTLNVNTTLAYIGLDTNASYVGFDFWSNSIIPNISGSLQLSLPPYCCRIIAVRPQSGVPELISTSRHITQGIIDVLAESWDGASTLSGTSKLVSGDPYEMRIYSTNNWQLQSASVSAADRAAGVTVTSYSESNGLARVTLNSPTSRQVNWSAVFTLGPAVALLTPTNNEMFYTNSLISLTATASDPVNPIAKVDFYNGSTDLGTVSNTPYDLAISNLAVGSYNFSAIATDNSGNTATSAVAQVQVQLFVPFTVGINPASLTIAPGGSRNSSVTITPTNSFNGTVSLGAAGVPSQASASFNPPSVTGSGTSTMTLTASNGIAPGTYNFTILGVSGGLTNSASFTLVVSGTANLTWTPLNNGIWDVNSTANWLNTGSGLNDTFQQGDDVLFDDTGSAYPNVTLGAGTTVQPASMVVNANTNSYSISGSGAIGGATSIEKDGAATLTISTANNFTGPVTINDGTLIAGASGALGNGATATINPGGTLDVGGIILTSTPVVVSGQGFGGNGAIVNNSGTSQTRALGSVTLAGDTTFGGSTRWDIRANTATLSTSGNPYNLTKVGPNQFSLVGVNVDSSLSNIVVQQGMFAVQTTTSQVGTPAGTITVYSNAILETWALSNNPLNKNIILDNGAIMTNESGSSIIAGPVTLQGTDTIGAVTSSSLMYNNLLSGSGSLIKSSPGIVYLTAANTYSGGTTVANGILALTNNGSISASSPININAGALLDASGRGDTTLTLASGQTLSGAGAVKGNVIIGSDATLAPGSPPATLSFSNNLTLNAGSLTVMQINKSLSPSNAVAQVTSNLIYGGTLMISNLGAVPFAAGDSFKLFNAAHYSGAFTGLTPVIPDVNLAWNTNNLTQGVLSVISSPTPPPVFKRTMLNGNNFILNGTNGVANWTYYVLASTNLQLPFSNWAVLSTNAFDAYGNFNFTSSPSPSQPPTFYLLQLH